MENDKRQYNENISVVMPVYNTAVPFLKEAVDSILNQTFGDFEFIIIDDGSTNDAKEYLDGLTDPRIRIIRNETNIGITKSLNIGIRAAQGKYIARMDSDDVSFPERFEKQYAFMEAHPDVIVCGTNIALFGGTVGARGQMVDDMDYYRAQLLFYNPGPKHPTAFLNHELLDRYHITYNEKLKYAQDTGLWVDVSRFGRVVILADILLKHRKHPAQISQMHRDEQFSSCHTILKPLLTELLDTVTDEEIDLHLLHCSGYYCPDAVMTPEVARWFRRIIRANRKKRLYDQKHIERRIEIITGWLLENTCKNEKSVIKKALLYLRYYPVLSVAIRKAKTRLLKISFVKSMHDALKNPKKNILKKRV